MHYAFQDRENLYVVIDLMKGGDLRYHMGIHKIFSEKQTCKLVVEVVINFCRVLLGLLDIWFGILALIECHT